MGVSMQTTENDEHMPCIRTAGGLLLSEEQSLFIRRAMEGHDILVDACIGSGKTTAIQELCNQYMARYRDRKILYLTYNKLLKIDAKKKIRMDGVQVTNYHGFAYGELVKVGKHAGLSSIVQEYNEIKPPCPRYDMLVIDEYQDIEEELAVLLDHIRWSNPLIQVIAVGDMAQKIYDKTRLDVIKFIDRFMGEQCLRMEFTKCFRISHAFAEGLGKIWKKKIDGVNDNCRVYCMEFEQIYSFLAEKCRPSDILCLGQNAGERSEMLNRLEEAKPEKFNKRTVWSNISDNDSGATSPSPECAVFTTYDGCKGMERNVCVLFDWTSAYWDSRLNKPDTRYEIIRNIFCVAASRGKHVIIFADKKDGSRLPWKTIEEDTNRGASYDDMQVSSMFNFKHIEDVESAYKCLEVKEVSASGHDIGLRTSDRMIDLSSCIGIYQEAKFFDKYKIEDDINQYFAVNRNKSQRGINWRVLDLEQKILYFVAMETNQFRYMTQVELPLVPDHLWVKIKERMEKEFPPNARVQKHCQIVFAGRDGKELFTAAGICDVIHDRKDGKPGDAVYELKYVSELSHTHALQCACYMAAFHLEIGYLFNVRDGQMLEIRIPDTNTFMDAVVRAVTKGHVKKFYGTFLQSEYTGKPDHEDPASEAPVMDDAKKKVVPFTMEKKTAKKAAAKKKLPSKTKASEKATKAGITAKRKKREKKKS